MRLYFLNPLKCDRKFCFVRGASMHNTKLMRGGAVLADMEEYSDEFIKYKMDEAKGGAVGRRLHY